MSLKKIKLIVADLDGTLLHYDKSLDRNIKSVLIEKNVPLTFVSGRNVHIIQDYIKELNITLPYITNNMEPSSVLAFGDNYNESLCLKLQMVLL